MGPPAQLAAAYGLRPVTNDRSLSRRCKVAAIRTTLNSCPQKQTLRGSGYEADGYLDYSAWK